MNTVETYLRKTYTTFLTLPSEVQERLKAMTTLVVHVWNQAIAECNARLETQEKLKQAGIKGDELKKCSITPFSLNYWLNGVDRQGLPTDVARQVLVKVSGSYKSFFELKKNKDKRARMPMEKPEDADATLALSWSMCTVKEKDNHIMLILAGVNRVRIEIPLDTYLSDMLKEKKVKYITLTYNLERKQWKVSVVCAYSKPSKAEYSLIRAIDLGAGHIAISDSSGDEYLIPTRRPDKYWRKATTAVEERLSKCLKGSRTYNRRMKARRTMHNKAHDQHKDHQRKLADAVTRKVGVVIIGKPHTRLGLAQKASSTPDQHWGVQNTGYLFRQLLFIKEKAQERGVQVIEIPDPKRKGELNQPVSKFEASRLMLKAGVTEKGESLPSSFVTRSFQFTQ